MRPEEIKVGRRYLMDNGEILTVLRIGRWFEDEPISVVYQDDNKIFMKESLEEFAERAQFEISKEK